MENQKFLSFSETREMELKDKARLYVLALIAHAADKSSWDNISSEEFIKALEDNKMVQIVFGDKLIKETISGMYVNHEISLVHKMNYTSMILSEKLKEEILKVGIRPAE